MVIKTYNCEWCGNIFTQDVNYVRGNTVSGSNPPRPGKRSALSDQVKCIKCGNFISTWEKRTLSDGTKVKIRRQ